MRATKIRLLFAVFSVCVVVFYFRSVSSCFASSSDDCTKLVGESHPDSDLRFCVCIPRFATLDDRDDRTNIALLVGTPTYPVHFSFKSSREGRVFYSVNRCFQIGGDPNNISDKQILKIWTPSLSAFYCVITRATLT